MECFRRSSSLALLALTIAVVADQASKAWIRANVAPGEAFMISGPVTITHLQNTGAVFGIGQGQVLIPTIGSVLVLALIPTVLYRLHSYYKVWPSSPEMVFIGLVAGGAIGNLVDRLRIGHVTDFIYVRLFQGVYWPAFNIADSCIVVATGVLVVLLIRRGVFDDAEASTS